MKLTILTLAVVAMANLSAFSANALTVINGCEMVEIDGTNALQRVDATCTGLEDGVEGPGKILAIDPTAPKVGDLS